MKLQQLRYALEVYRQNLNVSDAADALFTSQPGISKQIRLLEEELGVALFVRHGKRMVAVTAPGKAVLETAERILREVQNIKKIGTEFAGHDQGTLTLATTHTQARYALPRVVSAFVAQYPHVQLSILPAAPQALDRMVLEGEADFAIGTEWGASHAQLRKLSCHAWNRSVVVPEGHPLLALQRPLQLADLAAYPLISYEAALLEGTPVFRAFAQAGIGVPKMALASADTDIIKTYVKLGLGVGLMASMAFDAAADTGLRLISAEHLFEPSFVHIVLRADSYLRGYTYAFLEQFSPKLTRTLVETALYAPPAEDFSI